LQNQALELEGQLELITLLHKDHKWLSNQVSLPQKVIRVLYMVQVIIQRLGKDQEMLLKGLVDSQRQAKQLITLCRHHQVIQQTILMS